jgi:hypothetical protein
VHFRRIIHCEEEVLSVTFVDSVWRKSLLNTKDRAEYFLFCTLPVSCERFTRWDTVPLFGTGESGNKSLNSFYQVKWERWYARWCPTMNTLSTCEEDILALWLFEDNWLTGASRLQHDVTCVGSRVVTAILHWNATINKYFYVGCVTFTPPSTTGKPKIEIQKCMHISSIKECKIWYF